jgi:hypothetical protein
VGLLAYRGETFSAAGECTSVICCLPISTLTLQCSLRSWRFGCHSVLSRSQALESQQRIPDPNKFQNALGIYFSTWDIVTFLFLYSVVPTYHTTSSCHRTRDQRTGYKTDAEWVSSDDQGPRGILTTKWASTACRFIRRWREGIDPAEQMEILLSSTSQSPHFKRLDQLYTSILTQSFKTENAMRMRCFKLIMGIIMVAREPLSMSSLKNLHNEEDS